MWEKIKKAVQTEFLKRGITYICGAILAVPLLIWFLASEAGYKLVFAKDLAPIQTQLAANSSTLAWLRLENYERMIRRGTVLGRRECAKYYRLARALGVDPMRCK